MARQKMPLEMCKQLGMKPGSTYAQAVARAQFIKAMKGEVRNASEIREAILVEPHGGVFDEEALHVR